jgi:dihydrofolate reductase
MAARRAARASRLKKTFVALSIVVDRVRRGGVGERHPHENDLEHVMTNTTRKLVVTEFISLDGVMEAPGGDDGYVHGAWTMPYWCDEVGEFKTAEVMAADALLLGRITYNGFAAAWPERSGDPFTDKMNTMAKYVVSGTLTDPTWANTTVLGGGMVAAVTALKDQPGDDILVAGSATLAKALLAAELVDELVDELRLAVYPVMLGIGKTIYGANTRLNFEVTHSTTTSTGVVLTSYTRTELPAEVPTFTMYEE